MKLRLVPALLALLWLVPAAGAGLPVAQKVLTFRNAHTRMSVAYPRTGNRAIDAALAAYARENIAGARTDDTTLATTITYDVERNDDAMFAVTFDESVDLGGMHPQLALESFNFLRPEGTRIFLSDIIDGQRGIDLVSKRAIADLTRRLIADGSGVDPHVMALGAGPEAENFDTFFVTPDALHLWFAPYLVAGHSDGVRQAIIPLAQLKSVLRPDWRAPAASFDCARSATAIERAICADAALARLDRQVAESYRLYLSVSSAPDKYRQRQRDWLALRNRACPGAAPVPCLTRLYRARLAALKKPPF